MMFEGLVKNAHPKCWASVLGHCTGATTKEHIRTQALYKDKTIHVDGAPWLDGENMEIGRSKFASNMLGTRHHNKLSDVDNEAVKLSNAFNLARNPMQRPNSKIFQPPPEITISGASFGRWRCSAHCNILSVAGQIPEISYIPYSFAERPEKSIFFYFAVKAGVKLKIGDEHYKYFLPPIIKGVNPIYDFAIIFSGLIILISTNEISNFSVELILSLNTFQFPTPLGYYKILFDWKDESN